MGGERKRIQKGERGQGKLCEPMKWEGGKRTEGKGKKMTSERRV